MWETNQIPGKSCTYWSVTKAKWPLLIRETPGFRGYNLQNQVRERLINLSLGISMQARGYEPLIYSFIFFGKISAW